MRSSCKDPVKDLAQQQRDARISMAFAWNAMRKEIEKPVPNSDAARRLADAMDEVARLSKLIMASELLPRK